MVEIQCLICEKLIKFPSYIDPDDYDGQVVCQECNSLLHIKLKSSKVKEYKVVEKNAIVGDIVLKGFIPPGQKIQIGEDEAKE